MVDMETNEVMSYAHSIHKVCKSFYNANKLHGNLFYKHRINKAERMLNSLIYSMKGYNSTIEVLRAIDTWVNSFITEYDISFNNDNYNEDFQWTFWPNRIIIMNKDMRATIIFYCKSGTISYMKRDENGNEKLIELNSGSFKYGYPNTWLPVIFILKEFVREIIYDMASVADYM